MKQYHVIGIMSGSSLDGLDIAYCRFQEDNGKWTHEILNTHCHKFPHKWFLRLKNLVLQNAVTYLKTDVYFGHYIGEVVKEWIDETGIGNQLDFIVSHGQTVFHQPDNLLTSQIGDGAAIAAKTGFSVISNLRSMDVAYGGQGAPIVPLGEKHLYTEQKLFLNLGGIANISAHLENENVVAFDICPCNLLLNGVARLTGNDYDEDGKLASVGNIDSGLLKDLNSSWYYTKDYPKTLSGGFVSKVLWPIVKQYHISVEDKLRTLVEHIALQTKNHVHLIEEKQQLTFHQNDGILLSGGGALNIFLVEQLKEKLPLQVILPDKEIIDFKEAIIIAFLGVLRARNAVNVIQSVTGASTDTVNGAIYYGPLGNLQVH